MRNAFRFLPALLLFLTAWNASARERVLDCSLSDGELQGLTVYRETADDDTETLILSELDMNGDRHERTLSASEWKRKRIRLYARGRAKCWLIYEDQAWTFTYDAPGYRASGPAECD